MPKRIILLWAVGLLFSIPVLAEGECRGFRDCYDSAQAAEGEGKSDIAITYYELACPMAVKRVYGALKIAACEKIITLSNSIDNYATASTHFSQRCAQDVNEACFFLGRITERQGDLPKAIELMKPLCDAGFSLPVVSGYDSCDVLARLQQKWEIRNPKPARPIVLQYIAFFSIVALSFVAAVLFGLFLYTRNHRLAAGALIVSILVFLVYGYYESGVPASANIRIDLFIIIPALLVSLTIFFIVLLRRKKPDQPKH